jgi:hypothetical protein
MRRYALLAPLAMIAALFTADVPAQAQYGQCGIAPIPPVPPIGCRSMRPVCRCSGGFPAQCWWEFECIPR